ncbi:hypothetical protein T459_11968 [Capsicum annuum]|uniref:Uncharacterized protein n=1 Tax=Capsicum annuum TaxID=4072 RepID=A0A2G2ZNK5_CAPAN|nr:hypothetical protein T459_11968 [Capsicum annuum]
MVKYQLVEYHSLPGYLKDNEFIRGHYLSEWPVKQALLSVFTIHNETLNVWTVIPLVGSEEGGVYAIFALPCDGREVVSDRSLTQVCGYIGRKNGPDEAGPDQLHYKYLILGSRT